VDPDDQHLLVIRAVEDPDLAAGGQTPGVAPEEVVIQLLGRGTLKLCTETPWGFTPLITCRIVPSFPAASSAWSTSSTPQLSCAASRAWYSDMS